MSGEKETKSESEVKINNNDSIGDGPKSETKSLRPPSPDYYDAFIITQKCYGILKYSDTPDKGESFKCQGIKRLSSAHAMNPTIPGYLSRPMMTADQALYNFQRGVDLKHYRDKPSSDVGDGFGGSGGGSNEDSSKKQSRSKSLLEVMMELRKSNLIHRPIPPEEWKLVMDRQFDELQRQLEKRKSETSSGVHPGKASSAATAESEKTTTKEIHANLYGVTEIESLAMRKVKRHQVHEQTVPLDERSQKGLKHYKLVPINKFGVAKRTLKYIEKENPNAASNGNTISSRATRGRGHGSRKEYIASSTISRLGFFEIGMRGFQTKMVHPDDTDRDMDKRDDRRGVLSDDAKENDRKPGLLPLSSTVSPPSNSSIIPTNRELQELNDKFEAASNKILTHMRANANFLCRELQDDFFNRTMKAGERIVVSGGKNLERMKKMMMNGYKWFQDSGW